MKKCHSCKQIKSETEFNKNRAKKDGLCCVCKECNKNKCKNYYKLNKNIILEDQKIYYKKNSDMIKIRANNYYHNNKNKVAKKKKVYYNKTKSKFKQKRTDYARNKRKSDLILRLKELLRGRLYKALKNNFKTGSAVRNLGCSVEELKLYLESKFYPNPETGEIMSWDNYGLYGWHIDHIKPLASFNLENREELLQACHYTNLQPLWAKENLSKGAKLDVAPFVPID